MKKKLATGLAFGMLMFGIRGMGKASTPILWTANGHYYEAKAFPSGITWDNAKAYAETLIYNGLRGHLATITSAEENAFIVSSFGASELLPKNWTGGISGF